MLYTFKNSDNNFLGDPKDKIGAKAYRIQFEDEDDDTNFLAKRFSHLRLGPKTEEKDELESEFSDSDEDDLSYTQSPVPDDTKCKYF